MRIGISTACLYPRELEKAIDILGGFGAGLIEVFINTESELEPKFYKELKKRTDSFGLEVVSVHPYSSLMEGMLLFSEYGRRTEDGFKLYERYFECAAYLGAKFFIFHGEREMGFKDTPERWERKCGVYRRLCGMAGSKGITFTQENVNWCRSREPDFIRALSAEVPELRYTLDVKQARRAGKDWHEFVSIENGRLANIHISDYTETDTCVLPGRGEIDYGEFFSELRKVNYDGAVLLEVYDSDYDEPSELKAAAEMLSGYLR